MSYANISSQYNLELGANSFGIRSRYKINYNENTKIYQHYLFKDIKHPIERYLPFKYKLGNKTFINEESFVQYKNTTTSIIFGRKYSSIGPGKLSGLLVSPISPPLNQLSVSLNNIKGIENLNYEKYIIRLDNRSFQWNNSNEMVQRWFYINSIGLKSQKKNFEINFIDAVISTGFNRGLEWYYMLPLPNLIIERKHQEPWSEGSDTLSQIGKGDNDNHLLGMNALIKHENYKFYIELIIDEWQLSKDTRSNMQTVFGFLSGLQFNFNKLTTAIEYNLASPWLYLNRGLYANLEYQGIPLGLIKPHSHGLILGFNYKIDSNRNLESKLYTLSKGNQTLNTKWDAWNNFVNPFKFNSKEKAMFKLIYKNSKGKIINNIIIFNNWFNYQGLNFIISKIWKF